MKATMHNPVMTAAIMVVVAMTLIGFIDNFIKLIAAHGGLWQFHALRALMALPMIGLIALVLRGNLWPKNWGRVILRSALMGGSMLIYFGALAMLPVAEVGAGLFTAPIFVLVIQMTLFGVRIGPRRILAVIAGFLGVVVILRPEVGGVSLLTLIPVAAGILYAFGNVVTRQLCAEEETFTLLAGFFAALGIFGAIGLALVPPGMGPSFATTGWVTPNAVFLLGTLAQAVVSIVGVGLITRGYQIAEPSYVAIFEYWFLVSISVFGWLLWGDTVDPRTALGMVLIACAGAVIAVRAGPASEDARP